jgi:Tol biopolymer transport system component
MCRDDCNFPHVPPVFLYGITLTMANTNTTPSSAPPDWRQREHQRRMNRVLILAILLMILIAFYYYLSFLGNVGPVGGLAFDTSDHIAFVRQDEKGNTTLYAVRTDGTDLRALTPATDVSNKSHPVWTRDGKSLLYASNLRDNKVTQIYIMGTGSPKQLTYGPGTKSSPVISADGKTAAFIVQGAVKTVNLNGTDLYQVMPPPTGVKEAGDDVSTKTAELEGPFLESQFAADGIGIAGVQDVAGQHHATPVPGGRSFDQILMVIPGNGNKMVGLDVGHEVSFSWEPGGSRLASAYTEQDAIGPDGKMQLMSGIMLWSFKNPNKPEGIPLFAGFGFSVEPKHVAWSPDGKKIAFEAWRLKAEGDRKLRGIAIINDLTSVRSQVTPETVETVQCMIPAGPEGLPQNPRWSPDGSRLLFEVERPDGKHDLWLINADGTNKINLTKGVGDNTDGSWSPAVHKP